MTLLTLTKGNDVVNLPDKELLNVEELAAALDVPKENIYTLNKQGTGPSYFKVGRLIRYEREVVLKWLDSKTVAR